MSLVNLPKEIECGRKIREKVQRIFLPREMITLSISC